MLYYVYTVLCIQLCMLLPFALDGWVGARLGGFVSDLDQRSAWSTNPPPPLRTGDSICKQPLYLGHRHRTITHPLALSFFPQPRQQMTVSALQRLGHRLRHGSDVDSSAPEVTAACVFPRAGHLEATANGR